MTAQIEDRLRHRGADYAIAGILDDDLFYPGHYGLSPVMASTACYRGYIVHFALSSSQLILERLYVQLVKKLEDGYEDEKGPQINGVSPRFDKEVMFNNRYEELNLPLSYTGGLLLVKDPLNEFAFHRVWEYSTVLELIFEAGELKEEFDRSDSVEHLRNSIATSFKLDYML